MDGLSQMFLGNKHETNRHPVYQRLFIKAYKIAEMQEPALKHLDTAEHKDLGLFQYCEIFSQFCDNCLNFLH